MYITLEQAKRHLIIDEAYTDDDKYIESCLKTAEVFVSKSLRKPLESFLHEGVLEDDICHMILLAVANFYTNREPIAAVKMEELPLSFNCLLALNKDYSK